MDRYLVSAVLPRIQNYFEFDDFFGGVLHASYIIAFLVFLPIFMYLSNYFRHCSLLRNTCIIWIILSATSGFSSRSGLFMYLRMMVAICQSCFFVVAPQAFKNVVGNLPIQGPKWLFLYFLSGPLGCGMGFVIIGFILILSTPLSWRFCFWIVPVLLLCNLPVLCANKRSISSIPSRCSMNSQSNLYVYRVWDILKTPSFGLATVGFVCAHFFISAFYFWLPTYFYRSFENFDGSRRLPDVLLMLGGGIIMASLIGFFLGAWLSRRAYNRGYKIIDPIICGTGLLLSLPCMGLALFNASENIYITLVLATFSQIALCFYGAVAHDMLLYVIPPPDRALAWILHMIIVHGFGDAAGSLTVGILSTGLVELDFFTPQNNTVKYYLPLITLQCALSVVCLTQFFGSIFFFWSAIFIERDRQKVLVDFPVLGLSNRNYARHNFITMRSLYEL